MRLLIELGFMFIAYKLFGTTAMFITGVILIFLPQ
jgi:hypothetical protein